MQRISDLMSSTILAPSRALLLALLVLLHLLAAVALADDAGNEFFEKKIRPVLKQHCYECHSESAKEIKAGLRLDTADGLREGGDSGPAITPGDPDDSLLIKAVRYKEDDLQMPPAGKLPEATIKDLEEWVKRGAPDPRKHTEGFLLANKPGLDVEQARKFWSFQPPHMAPPPQIKDASWASSEIDRFILAGLEAQGLTPVADASRSTLLRRVYFDLLGLPPKPEEIDDFLAN
jgi:hypothetical protein